MIRIYFEIGQQLENNNTIVPSVTINQTANTIKISLEFSYRPILLSERGISGGLEYLVA